MYAATLLKKGNTRFTGDTNARRLFWKHGRDIRYNAARKNDWCVERLVPGSPDRERMMRNLPMLPELCANSQWERETVFRHFLSSA
jgi:hypothetical protein